MPILTYIGYYLHLQWLIAAELPSKVLALGVTVIVLELFVLHLILGMFDFAFVLHPANCSFAAQACLSFLGSWQNIPFQSQMQAYTYCSHALRLLRPPALCISNSGSIIMAATLYRTYGYNFHSYAEISHPI